MDREQVLQLLRRRPFQPFRVHLRDGQSYDIRFAHLAMAGMKHLHIGHPVPDQPDPFYDGLTIVKLADVVRLEPLTDTQVPAVK